VSFIRDSALYIFRRWKAEINRSWLSCVCMDPTVKHLSSRSPTEGQNDKTNVLKNLTNGAGGRTGFLAPTCGFALGSFTSEMLSLIWIVMHVDVLG